MALESELREKLARAYLDALITDYLIQAGEPVKTVDLVRAVGEDFGLGVRLIRDELSHSPRLVFVDRRWDLSLRRELLSRSVDGFIRHFLREHGKPVSVSQLAQELARVRGHLPEHYYSIVERLVETRQDYFITTSGLCGLSEWLGELEVEDEEEFRRRNFFLTDLDPEAELSGVNLKRIARLKSPLRAAQKVLQEAKRPVHHQVLVYALWKTLGVTIDSLELFELLLEEEQVALLPGPMWSDVSLLEELAETLLEMSLELEEATVVEQKEIDLDAVLAEKPSPEEVPFTLSPEDLEEIVRTLEEAGKPVPLPDLVTEVLELFPGDEHYRAALRGVQQHLSQDPRFLELSDHHWHLRAFLPPTLYRVPVTLELSPIQVRTLAGELVDAPLSDEGLEGLLALEVHAPDLEDIGEEGEVGEIRAGVKLVERARYVTNYRHFVSGTLKVRKIDRGVFPPEPDLLQVTAQDAETGETFQLWLNNQTGLLCGLDVWYNARQLHPAGQIFFLEVAEEPGRWIISTQGEMDPFLFIPPERLEELLVLRTELEHEAQVSALEIMRQVMASGEPFSFRRLYVETNLVRRVSKRIIASNLSSYPCFSLAQQEENLWVYEEKKAHRTRSPAKKKFILEEET